VKKFCIALVLVSLITLPLLAQTAGSWEIIRADYGSGNNWVDVTDRVRSLVQGGSLNFRVDGNALGEDYRRGRNRTLRLQLQDRQGRSRQITYRDNQQVNLQIYNAYQSTLRINRAIYGNGNRSSDVTSRLNSQIQGGQLNVEVNNQTMGGDPAPQRAKTLTVQYALNGRNSQVVINEGDTLRLPNGVTNSQGNLQINRAIYGAGYRTSDVTSRLNSQIQNNQLYLQVNSSSMGGDPAPGQVKTLTVQYALNGRPSQIVVNEGDTLQLPYGTTASQNNLHINRATYGSGYRTSDVTSRLNSQIQNDQLYLQVNSSSMGGDPAPGQVKTLTVEYALNGRPSQIVVNEGDTLQLPYGTITSQNNLHINRATYGSGYRTSDVTSRLNSQIQNNQLNLQVNNDSMGGDPDPGQTKTLTVQYALNGRTSQVVVNEGDTLRLPYGTTSGPYGTTSQLSERIRCESLQTGAYGRKYCPANTRGGVRLSRTLGNSQCVQGSSWGYDSGGVWVDNGCQAEFEIQGQGNGRSTRSITSATIPSGTELSVRTNETIDSKTASVDQTFSAVIAADVLDSSGAVTIPKGSEAQLVIRSANGGSITSASDLVLDVDSVTVSGTRYLISTGDLQQQGGQGVGANKKTAIMVGGGAALGTLIGAIVGGGKGAAIGAAVGAAGGLGTEVLTRGKQVRVPAETLLNFKLDQDLRLQAMRY
jgi:membrane-bound inhibitor of C-type lysozyme